MFTKKCFSIFSFVLIFSVYAADLPETILFEDINGQLINFPTTRRIKTANHAECFRKAGIFANLTTQEQPIKLPISGQDFSKYIEFCERYSEGSATAFKDTFSNTDHGMAVLNTLQYPLEGLQVNGEEAIPYLKRKRTEGETAVAKRQKFEEEHKENLIEFIFPNNTSIQISGQRATTLKSLKDTLIHNIYEDLNKPEILKISVPYTFSGEQFNDFINILLKTYQKKDVFEELVNAGWEADAYERGRRVTQEAVEKFENDKIIFLKNQPLFKQLARYFGYYPVETAIDQITKYYLILDLYKKLNQKLNTNPSRQLSIDQEIVNYIDQFIKRQPAYSGKDYNLSFANDIQDNNEAVKFFNNILNTKFLLELLWFSQFALPSIGSSKMFDPDEIKLLMQVSPHLSMHIALFLSYLKGMKKTFNSQLLTILNTLLKTQNNLSIAEQYFHGIFQLIEQELKRFISSSIQDPAGKQNAQELLSMLPHFKDNLQYEVDIYTSPTQKTEYVLPAFKKETINFFKKNNINPALYKYLKVVLFDID
jgi:hypothetical protein